MSDMRRGAGVINWCGYIKFLFIVHCVIPLFYFFKMSDYKLRFKVHIRSLNVRRTHNIFLPFKNHRPFLGFSLDS